MKDLHKTTSSKDTDNPEQAMEGRRKFLKQAGKIALYAPPAVMVLSKPSFAGSRGSKSSWTGGQPKKSWKGSKHSWKGSNHSWKGGQRHTGPVRKILGSVLHGKR